MNAEVRSGLLYNFKKLAPKMHFLSLIISLLIPAHSTTRNISTASDIQSLQSCVELLKNVSLTYKKRIPAPVFLMDRKLHTMNQGIPFLEQNATLLKNRLSESGEDPKFGILVLNAIDGCQSFKISFEDRARRLFLLVVSSLLSFASFAGWYFFVGCRLNRK